MTKLEAFRNAMKERDLDAVLVTDELNQRYLTGFPITDGYCLVTKKTAVLLTDFRYREEALSKVTDFEVVVPESFFAYIDSVTEAEKIKKIAFEDLLLPCAERDRIAKYLRAKLVPAGDLFDGMRLHKWEDELDAMRRAQAIADRAFADVLGRLKPDMTEHEVALELEFTMRRMGAENVSFETICVSGSASSLPHGKPRNQKLERGFLTMDFGCKIGGYCSDMTRTVVVGKADGEMKRLYQTVLDAQLAALSVIGPGKDCAAVDSAARDLIYAAGYEGCFGHGLGHGVGLLIHEAPRLSQVWKGRALEVGHVVTVEPGIYIAGKYGCRIEDMGVVTQNGFENFTKSPKELIELF